LDRIKRRIMQMGLFAATVGISCQLCALQHCKG
jgi:hypothetical protein